jgi:two-component system CheB/CheR fusion protein
MIVSSTPSMSPRVPGFFARVGAALAAPVRGRRSQLGIGLALVRELVEAHGGSVVARSAGTGLGSQFVVTLPLGEGDAKT